MARQADELQIPLPRDTTALVGHDATLAAFEAQLRGGRPHQAWLLTGPEGIGKATAAYAVARHLLSGGATEPPDRDVPLFVPPDDPITAQVGHDAAPGLFVYECRPDPETGRPRTNIVVNQVRAHEQHIRMRTGGGWRVAIVDSVDELTPSAANALLKIIEEPPAQTLFLLINHAPGRVLPTIRSRCQLFPMPPLPRDTVREVISPVLNGWPPGDVDLLADLGEGSPGRALSLAEAGGAKLHRSLERLLESLPTPDIRQIHKLGDELSADRTGRAFRTAGDLMGRWLSGQTRRQALTGADADLGELDRQARVWEKVSASFARAEHRHLDRKQAFINAFHVLQGEARRQ